MFDAAEVHLALNRNSHGDSLFEDVLDVQTELQKQRDKDEGNKRKPKNANKFAFDRARRCSSSPFSRLCSWTEIDFLGLGKK